jgi:hypothetical protein
MIDPLPRWAKGLVAVVGVVIVALVVVRVLDDGFGHPQPAIWRIAPSAELGPDTLDVPVIVNEVACSSGRSAEGRIAADVTYGDDVVDLDIGVRPLGGNQTCPSNPDTPFVVELDEPLGDRTVSGEHGPTP